MTSSEDTNPSKNVDIQDEVSLTTMQKVIAIIINKITIELITRKAFSSQIKFDDRRTMANSNNLVLESLVKASV